MKQYFRNLGIGMFVVGILFFFLFPDVTASLKKPIELYAEDTDVTKLSNRDHVQADIYAVFDYFATGTTVDGNTGHIIGSDGTTYYYLIPVFVPEDETNHYLAVMANTKSAPNVRKKLSAIMADTKAYMKNETNTLGTNVLKMDAICQKMNDELTEMMYDYFRDLDYTEDQIKTYVHPYCLRVLNQSTAKTMLGVSIFLTSVGIILAVSMIVITKREKERIKNQTEVVINGVAYPMEMFAPVHKQVLFRNPKAVTDLMELTGLSQPEAANIINHWGKYYYY